MFEEMRQSVVAVMSKTFATMFFLDIEPQEMGKIPGPAFASGSDPHEVESSNGFIRSRIRFQGPRSGMISLVLPAALAKVMANNFLGLEEGEASKSQTCDVAGELANIISGNLLSALDQKGSYSLSPPETGPNDDPEMDHPGLRRGFALDFDAEGHWVQFRILLGE